MFVRVPKGGKVLMNKEIIIITNTKKVEVNKLMEKDR
jgi:hypothetical protein